MTDRPILFSAPMVRAILAGSKTQTRRAIRIDDTPIVNAKLGKLQRGIPTNAVNVRHIGCYLKCDAAPGSDTVSARVACPYGEHGDRLWVRETFARVWAHAEGPSDDDVTEYRADTNAKRPGGWDDAAVADLGPSGAKWTPSIFMRRKHSRLTLEITSVRVERVQAISEEDARAEGFPYGGQCFISCAGEVPDGETPSARVCFKYGWKAINDPRGGPCSWYENPWVWCVSFRRVEP